MGVVHNVSQVCHEPNFEVYQLYDFFRVESSRSFRVELFLVVRLIFCAHVIFPERNC